MTSGKITCYAYERRSNEEYKSGESTSIGNQRDIIREYCKNNGLTIVEDFSDDGYSGSNFDRPGFQRMIDSLSKNDVKIVLTKDLSRLGRDMSESSYYAETYFPEHGIQYIAIKDDFDSEQTNPMAPFQFAMNDVYIREASKKVKDALRVRRNNGVYCACPPYGYKKKRDRSGTLVPDAEAAAVVQRIFSMANDGMSTRTIADTLTAESVMPPLLYKITNYGDFSDRGAAKASPVWQYETVKRILKNRVYVGDTILGKMKKPSIRSKKKVKVEKAQWSVTEGTHEPLVSQEDFNSVQKILQSRARDWRVEDKVRRSIFGGIAVCGNCGGAMCSGGSQYNGDRQKYWYLICNNIPIRSKNHCENGARIKYAALVQVITNELNRYLDFSEEEKKEIVRRVEARQSRKQSTGKSEDGLLAAKRRMQELDNIIAKLYADNIAGKIDDDRLDRMVGSLSEESSKLSSDIKRMEGLLKKSSNEADAYKRFFALVNKYSHIDELTEDIVRTFIDRIEIYPKQIQSGRTISGIKTQFQQEIRIFYKFIGEIKIEATLGS